VKEKDEGPAVGNLFFFVIVANEDHSARIAALERHIGALQVELSRFVFCRVFYVYYYYYYYYFFFRCKASLEDSRESVPLSSVSSPGVVSAWSGTSVIETANLSCDPVSVQLPFNKNLQPFSLCLNSEDYLHKYIRQHGRWTGGLRKCIVLVLTCLL
jgi:hypothetical protein